MIPGLNNHIRASLNPIENQHTFQAMHQYFRSSKLPPLISRRSTINQAENKLHRNESENVSLRHKRYVSVDVRKSMPKVVLGSRRGASLLHDAPSYAKSLAQSKALLNELNSSYNNKSTAAASSAYATKQPPDEE
jgi:hypothetical protein